MKRHTIIWPYKNLPHTFNLDNILSICIDFRTVNILQYLNLKKVDEIAGFDAK